MEFQYTNQKIKLLTILSNIFNKINKYIKFKQIYSSKNRHFIGRYAVYLLQKGTKERHFADDEIFCFSKKFVEQRIAILNTLSEILDFMNHFDSVSDFEFIKDFQVLQFLKIKVYMREI